MRKQILVGALVASIILSGASAFATVGTQKLLISPNNAEKELINEEAEEVKEDQEDKDIEFNLEGVETYKKGETVMVPLREVAENQLGLKVTWKNEDRSVEIGEGPQWTSIKIGVNSYFFARMAPFELSYAPEIKNNLTYVPVEFFTEVLRYNVSTDEEITEEKENILDGFIKEIDNVDERKSILLVENEDNKFIEGIVLHISEETIIVDKEDNIILFEDLEVGTKIKTVLPEIMTMSLPPQGTAVKIIVEDIK